MKTKINISAEMREFNEAVEACDGMTDYKHDTESAEELLDAVKAARWPHHAEYLANAIAGIAIKR